MADLKDDDSGEQLIQRKDDTPEACWNDIPDEDKKAAMSYGETMGAVGLKILEDAKK